MLLRRPRVVTVIVATPRGARRSPGIGPVAAARAGAVERRASQLHRPGARHRRGPGRRRGGGARGRRAGDVVQPGRPVPGEAVVAHRQRRRAPVGARHAERVPDQRLLRRACCRCRSGSLWREPFDYMGWTMAVSFSTENNWDHSLSAELQGGTPAAAGTLRLLGRLEVPAADGERRRGLQPRREAPDRRQCGPRADAS